MQSKCSTMGQRFNPLTQLTTVRRRDKPPLTIPGTQYLSYAEPTPHFYICLIVIIKFLTF